MVLVIDSQVAGIAGDMILSSLVDMGSDKARIIDGIRSAEKLLDGVRIKKIDFVRASKHGMDATRMVLELDEDHDTARGTVIMDCIGRTCEKIGLSGEATAFAASCISTLIAAESRIHGEPADSVHFHEASSFDTIADIVGTAIAADDLSLFDEEIVCTPVAVGSKTIEFSHGVSSNPAGAILEIFRDSGVMILGNQTGKEMTTPTGACILVNLSGSCQEFYPMMRVEHTGYGAGARDFEGFANVLKLVRGPKNEGYTSDTVNILETNIDDATGEALGHMIEKTMQAGASDVTVSPAITKKGRPTHLVSVICRPGLAAHLADLLVSETGTLGVRVRTSGRIRASRRALEAGITLKGRDFTVRYKANDASGRFKIEADDIRTVSESLGEPFGRTEELIRNEINRMVRHEKA